MIIRSHLPIVAALTLSALSASLIRAQDPPEKLDLSELPAILVDQVVVPIPAEIFLSLDKLGPQDWRSQIQSGEQQVPSDRTRAALQLGLSVANGFIAVQAESKEDAQRVGREIINLGESLGIRQALLEHVQSVTEYSKAENWKEVRQEFDRALGTVQSSMEEMKDDDVVSLVSLGTWLGGTRALSSILTTNYQAEGSELLNQPDLVDQINDMLNRLPQSTLSKPLVVQVKETLDAMRPLVQVNEQRNVPLKDVKTISELANRLAIDILKPR